MEVFPWNNHPTSWAAPRAAIRGGASGSHFQILQLMERKILAAGKERKEIYGNLI